METIESIKQQTANLTLLYVESDKTTRDATLGMLREFFKDILVAVDGREGLETFHAHAVDLVITDIHIPELSGLEMAEAMLRSHPDVAIIILSAQTEHNYLQQSIKLGIKGYLSKPIELPYLIDVLRNTISQALLRAEREHSAREKERYSQYIHSIISSIQDPIMVIRQDHSIEFLNDISFMEKKMQRHHSTDTCYGLFHDRDTPCDPADRVCPLREVERTLQSCTVLHTCHDQQTPSRYEILASALLGENDRFIGIVGTARDVTHHLTSQERLHAQAVALGHQARHDTLTQLANRTFLTEKYLEAIREADAQQSMVAVLFIDLDKFKSINDTLGHPMGDLVLKSISQTMRQAIRKRDTLARIGGDEFALIALDITSPDESSALAYKILEAIEKPVEIEGDHVELSASIGIAHYPADGSDLTALLKKADQAMYLAKTREVHIATYASS